MKNSTSKIGQQNITEITDVNIVCSFKKNDWKLHTVSGFATSTPVLLFIQKGKWVFALGVICHVQNNSTSQPQHTISLPDMTSAHLTWRSGNKHKCQHSGPVLNDVTFAGASCSTTELRQPPRPPKRSALCWPGVPTMLKENKWKTKLKYFNLLQNSWNVYNAGQYI